METENTNKQFSIDNLLEKAKEALRKFKEVPGKLKAGLLAALAMGVALVLIVLTLFPSGRAMPSSSEWARSTSWRPCQMPASTTRREAGRSIRWM